MRKMMIFPVLLFIVFSCSGGDDFIEQNKNTLYEEIDRTVYDTIYHAQTDSLGNEIVDTIITERTETIRNDLKVSIDSLIFQFAAIGNGSMQGADCYGKYFFQFSSGFKYAYCYDMTNGKRLASFKLPGAPEGLDYHCNNADFSNTFYDDDDEFPLIYVSHPNSGHVSVCRIIRKQNTFTLDVVQTIVYTHLTNPDITIDKENGYMYASSYKNGTVHLYKYYIPDHHIPGEVLITQEKMLETFDTGYTVNRQGSIIKKNYYYLVEGVPNQGTDVFIKIVNLHNGSYSRINLSKTCGFYCEPEDVFFFNGDLYCATNSGKGVYKVYMSFNN